MASCLDGLLNIEAIVSDCDLETTSCQCTVGTVLLGILSHKPLSLSLAMWAANSSVFYSSTDPGLLLGMRLHK